MDRVNETGLARSIRDLAWEEAALAIVDTRQSLATRRAYRADVERWLRWCYGTGATPRAPSVQDAVAFREAMLANLSATSVRRVLAALSFVYRQMLQAGGVRHNVFHPGLLAWPPEDRIGKTAPVTHAEASAILAAAAKAEATRDLAVLRLLYDTGLRRSSVASMRRDKFEGADRVRVTIKGGAEAWATLPPRAVEALRLWLGKAPQSPFVFPGRGGHIDVGMVNKIVARWANAARCPHVHPHCFRTTFATDGYDAGLPEHEVQASLHHTDPRTTRRYDRGTRGANVATIIAKKREVAP